MKLTRFFSLTTLAMAGIFVLPSCSSNDDPTPEPGPEPTEQDWHFDLWISTDKHSGMGAKPAQVVVRSVNSLDADQEAIDFKGSGAEVGQELTMETICHGAYYYQIPVNETGLRKFTITNDRIENSKYCPFSDGQNTFKSRNYTHVWLDETTLVIMGGNGSNDKVLWSKYDTEKMTLISEGVLGIDLPGESTQFTTSGIAAYRKSDNKIFYFYYGKGGTGGGRASRSTPMYTAVLDPSDMSVKKNLEYPEYDMEMVSSAYGELMQTSCFFDESDNLYLACFSGSGKNTESHLLRILKNSDTFESGYDGFTHYGKAFDLTYLGNNKVMVYGNDYNVSTSASNDVFNNFYFVADIQTHQIKNVEYDGSQLPYSSSRWASRVAYVDGMVYLGTNPSESTPQIYIYDVASGNVTLGVKLNDNYYFDEIRVMKNLN